MELTAPSEKCWLKSSSRAKSFGNLKLSFPLENLRWILILPPLLLFLLAAVACDNNGDNTAPSGPAPSTPAPSPPAPSDTTAPTTTASPAGGTYLPPQSVTLTCNDGAGTGCNKTYYTIDGSTPTPSSSVYSAALAIAATTTLKFFSTDIAGNAETVRNESYALVCRLGSLSLTDPLVQYQWHLENTGQTAFSDNAGTPCEDLNLIQTIASGFTGNGVKVAVVDTGLEIAHGDLAPNVVSGASWDFVNLDTDPTNTAATNGDHGTSVAGLIAARGENGIGSSGVAPMASLVGYNFLSGQSTANQVDSLGGATGTPFKSDDVFVFNQSYGTNLTDDFLINSLLEAQLVDGVTNLRGGKGAIYVKSSGNGFGGFGSANCSTANSFGVSCQNASMDPSNSAPWNIVTGALNALGLRSSYSTSGSALWMSAPGGEFGYAAATAGSGFAANIYQPAMITVDQSGCSAGYSPNSAVNPFQLQGHAENPNCDYTSTFNGTSSAAPVLAGAIALILEANPALTWRDVKHILASTAKQVDAGNTGTSITLGGGAYQAELGWTTNAAGYKFHNWYGFGRVDVDAAVTMAQGFSSTFGTFGNTGFVTSGVLSLSIPDNSPTGVPNVNTVSSALTFIEAVQISVSLTHTWTGDIAIELTSPQGTQSILFTTGNGFGSSDNLNGMILLSNAFYGEAPNGNWTIKIVDGFSGLTGTLTEWQIKIFGH